jgi:putative drug exporter of the RND superfamily
MFAIAILLIAFGSVLAMGLPIASALFGIGIGLSLIMLFANFLSVPDFTPQLASMIGIGVGIDYALFIVTRYRQQLHHGLDPEQATMVAITTSGKAVLFAGTTVVIALLGILLMGFAFVEGLAIGGAATVAVTMVASVTLVPALLGFVGRNIDRWRLPLFHQDESKFEHGPAYRWSRLIQKRPWPAAILGLAVLVAMSIPLFSIRLGFADASSASRDRSSRRAYDLMTEGFGPGFSGPLLLATEVDSPDDVQSLESVGQALSQTDGIAAVTPAQVSPNEDAAVLTAFPTTSPQEEATTDLVNRLRDDVIPEANGDGNPIYVGGFTASIVDFSEANADRLPILIAVVIALSFILLVIVFRSLVVPLKAAIMNLLSISAAYGAVIAIFQWGWLKDLFGVETTAPFEAWAPMMLFTILFGLSMDYEIFLLSRIREEYVRTRDNKIAVANGLAATARVITAAAAIMVTLFLVFVFGFEERAIKLFGLGLAVAIFVDATIVRMVLVPATMELLGDANWWLPKWLARILPRFEIEGEDKVVSHVLEETGGLHPDEDRERPDEDREKERV